MKNNIYTIPLLLVLAFSLFLNACTKENSLEFVKAELIDVSEKEINAFKNGECETLDHFIHESATFYMDGRKAPSKEMVIKFCKQIKRPFEKPSLVAMEYEPTSTNSGYVIRTMEFSKDENVYKREIVTKVWVKGNNGWQIVHLHSTIKEL